MAFIDIRNLTKKFGATTALCKINLRLEKNKIYGLLGRNGAGKTTLLNIMTNKLIPTEGEVLIEGQCVKENDAVLSRIYCMNEKKLYPESLTVNEVFYWSQKFYSSFDQAYAAELSQLFGLKTRKKISELSTGYSSVFKIIVALASNAEIILLDEPILGLDANHRDLFYKELLKNYSINPRTIVISTHLIEEVSDIIEEVIIISKGKTLLFDTVENLLSQGYTVSGSSTAVENYIAGKNVLGVDSLGGLKSAYILDQLNRAELPEGLEISKLDLQKLFVHLTNSKEVV